jgi:hypothetical protein
MSQKSVVAQAVAEHCGNDIVAAVTAQNSADGKWERAARSLFKQGARVEMLKRKPRGPEFDESLETVVEAFIVQAMTASTKPFKFSAGSFTFAEILDLDRHQLRELDDKVISATKVDCIRTVASRYGLIVRHLDKFQNPIKVQEERDAAKAAKEETKSETVDPIVTIQGWINQATKMVDVTDVSRFQDAGHEMIACLRRIRKS